MTKRQINKDVSEGSDLKRWKKSENAVTPVLENEKALEQMIANSEEDEETSDSDIKRGDKEEKDAEDEEEDEEDDYDSDDDIIWNEVDLQQDSTPQELNIAETIVISKKIDPNEYQAISPEKEARRRKIEASNREKTTRLTTHVLHTQSLIHHGSIRNEWINNVKLQKELKQKLPKPLRSAFKKHAKHVETGKNIRKPDEVIDNLSVLVTKLAVYFRKAFQITSPGLVVNGYCQTGAVDSEEFILLCSKGERFYDFEEFYKAAMEFKGSRDLGAQVFCCILRSLGVESRLIFSPPVLGYTLHKRESFTPNRTSVATPILENSKKKRGETPDSYVPEVQQIIDSHLAYPIFWTEVYDPKLKSFIPFDPMTLPFPNYEDLASGAIKDKPTQFEPSGPYACNQKMYYVIGYENDMNCRDLTPKYMDNENLPQILTLTATSLIRPTDASSFKDVAYLLYLRSIWLIARKINKKSEALKLEDDQMRKWIQATKQSNDTETEPTYPNVLSAYKSHPTLTLHSKLNKSQALRPGSKPVHSFTIKTTKGTRTEAVYLLKDILNCRPQAAWYKEGRVIKPSEKPLITEKVKPSTRNGRRKLESSKKYGDNSPETTEQGLYSYDQTIEYIPPEVPEGEPIPKNEFGRIEIFTPNMVPKGTVHLKHPGLGKIAKKLGIDYVPAVVGFFFQSRYAKPDIDGGIVPKHCVDVLLDAWRLDQEIKREKEDSARKEDALARWKLYLVRIQLLNRLKQKYGDN